MSGGDIAGLIGAGVFAILVAIIALPLIKLGRVFDETTVAIRELSASVTPLLAETTETLAQTNAQLARVDTITSNVADATGNISALVALFAATVGGPLIKLAGFTAGLRAAFRVGRPSASRRERA
ncbi:DUF948 domain-containing protein [Cryobacterium sp. CG_9.6]|uniref:DUF948 domain-containing protein n=1 Tax=Cryobacterium sp. CG_9.6 TaxID=2760710 RepID=UPI0024746BB3|nr:DUF948 domain-containing protein [Cryobacterium sp. CG_9.6]MDH6237303.1 uncharacterized protein YoxC [Cryobacterium sp. CG_9.6]